MSALRAGRSDGRTTVCQISDLVPDRGVCALVDGRPVAVFLLSGSGALHAIDNVDPFSGASVISRGLVGTAERDGEWVPYVASPLRRQRFALGDGRCLDDDAVRLRVHPVALDGDRIVVGPVG